MKKESVLILGAGLMQSPAINAAKRNGFKTFVIDANPNVIIDDWRELLEVLEGDHEWTYNMI